MNDAILRLFEAAFGAPAANVVPVAADGSVRRYCRLTGARGETAIGGIGSDHEENAAFISFSRSFRGIDLPVPEIYGVDEGEGVWLEEDLGDTTLFAALSAARSEAGGGTAFPESMVAVYERVVDLLPRFQVHGGRVVDYSVAYPRPVFDLQSILWDLNYFKYHFLKLARIPFNEERLEDDFRRLADFLLRADTSHFMYRDFQSRNIMIRPDGSPWFIDYQGGRRGALQYDIASLLYDAKAAVPEAVRDRLLTRYIRALETHLPVDEERFREFYTGYVIVRIMQAMGAYGYRGFFERKPRFLQSVPYAARNLERLVARGLPVRLPELETAFARIVEAWALLPVETDATSGLSVHITSFSYRRGYPEDAAGHGGGFVFDCRAVPNPGREMQFASLSGLDGSVIEFLNERAEVGAFLENTTALVDAHVQDFLRRGFTSLSIAFGCTGGQHRSVYFAERVAAILRMRHPTIAVRVEHREQDEWPKTAARPASAAAAADTMASPANG